MADMPSPIDQPGLDRLITAAKDVLAAEITRAVHTFNLAERGLQEQAVKQFGREPWRFFMGEEFPALEVALGELDAGQIVLKEMLVIRPSALSGGFPMKGGCGGDLAQPDREGA